MICEANSASYEHCGAGTGIVLLIANLTHFKLLENEQLPAVNGFFSENTGLIPLQHRRGELRCCGCFRKSHINVNQGQLSELLVSKLLSFRGQISKKKK